MAKTCLMVKASRPPKFRVRAYNRCPLCGRCNKPARIGNRRLEDGRGARICERCGDVLEQG